MLCGTTLGVAVYKEGIEYNVSLEVCYVEIMKIFSVLYVTGLYDNIKREYDLSIHILNNISNV